MSFERGPQTPDVRISDLRRRVVAEPMLQAELLPLLERKGLSGAIVPVEVAHPVDEVGPQQPPEQCWVEWKRVYRPKTAEELAASTDQENDIEIPGSIEKILRVILTDEPINDLIAKGNYDQDWLSEYLTDEDRSKKPEAGERELFLPKFDRNVSTEEVEKWLKENDLMGATQQELLAVGYQIPEEQRRVYILALEEAWRSRGLVLVLTRDARERRVHLAPRDFQWSRHVRPLAARKFAKGGQVYRT